ncbi:hypothetical protein RND71_023604 [Anisodus tanguticus]|uniref:Uncharacterized protein n=1 Tax=Anisodus tanguticus TaxID=243964 RepID=A0AAE1RVG8_9SOLA|nr:hypothetical protein RND71_023604 [Anisodus tanguticus]
MESSSGSTSYAGEWRAEEAIAGNWPRGLLLYGPPGTGKLLKRTSSPQPKITPIPSFQVKNSNGFHNLTLRELQALWKKNNFPANMTNVAMADALSSLEFVKSVEESSIHFKTQISWQKMNRNGSWCSISGDSLAVDALNKEAENVLDVEQSHCIDNGLEEVLISEILD